MECDGCNNKNARAIHGFMENGVFRCLCDLCGGISVTIKNADVYWEGPGYNRGICDDNGAPIYLESKSHKVKLMKEKGLREAGDMLHGTRGTEAEKVNSLKLKRQADHKTQVKNAGRIFREGLRKLKS